MVISWLAVAAWLYFAFIEKALWSKLFSGEALLVDLLLGLPLVLMLAVVVYATLYWLLKLLVVVFLPQAIVPAESEHDAQLDENHKALEETYGERYWENLDQADVPDSKRSSVTRRVGGAQRQSADSTLDNSEDSQKPSSSVSVDSERS
ncbi:hypothetical protein QCB44_04995 [Thiomicrorhabdus sp. zzn3]|uniref:hypothetical protein n=1 Tax=Thiomicrorhabdus sp. zzn3 TaxID=3039775 RepID=UPI002437265C|nr:hypothetical protein [Thiomicrorhabdus sp. zzn3]MDG6778059.1 hypothetical protein [Thiomicrorhabdus sp. zzn3]